MSTNLQDCPSIQSELKIKLYQYLYFGIHSSLPLRQGYLSPSVIGSNHHVKLLKSLVSGHSWRNSMAGYYATDLCLGVSFWLASYGWIDLNILMTCLQFSSSGCDLTRIGWRRTWRDFHPGLIRSQNYILHNILLSSTVCLHPPGCNKSSQLSWCYYNWFYLIVFHCSHSVQTGELKLSILLI